MSTNYTESLSEIEILRGISAAERGEIANRCTWQRFRAHQQIIWHGDRSTDVFFVVQGRLRAINYASNGKEVSFSDIKRGEVFGEYAALDGRERSANVFAVEDSFIGALDGKAFVEVLETHNAVALAMLRRLTGEIRGLNDRVFEFSTLAVNNRIQAELLRLSIEAGISDNEARIHPAPTHSEIASRVSTHREAVSRELSRLSKDRVVSRKGRTLIVTDCDKLRKAVALTPEIPPHPVGE